MTSFLLTPVLAAETAGVSTEKLMFDTPKTFEHWLVLVVVAAALLAYVAWMYIRDTRSLSFVWTMWLMLLRTAVIAGIAIIYFNPHMRSQTFMYRPSQVAIVVDRSLSMRFPATDLSPGESAPAGGRLSRTEAVTTLLAQSDLLNQLNQKHQLQFYTFSRTLQDGPARLLSQSDPAALQDADDVARQKAAATDKKNSEDGKKEPAGDEADAVEDEKPSGDAFPVRRSEADDTAELVEQRRQHWQKVLQPGDEDQDTRLGEAVIELLRKFRGETVAGVVVVTDGGSNAGVRYTSAIDAARDARVKLFGVGVGSSEQQRNLYVSGLESPSLVATKDAFDLTAYVQGQNLSGETVEVVLLAQTEEDGSKGPLEEVARKTIELGDDGVPQAVKFEQTRKDPVTLRYVVEARPSSRITELKTDDNSRDATVTVSERRTRALIVAGGPTRDYRFLTGILSRHKGIRVDAWLQSIEPGTADAVSQNVDELRTSFPATMEELNGDPTRDDDQTGYDVIIFFDPDWKQIAAETPEALPLLSRWISEFSGGAIFVAGDVFTPDLASSGDELKEIRALYPVFLSPNMFFGLQLGLDSESDQAWPLALTDAGKAAGFLQVADNPQDSLELWSEGFEGFYRCYPTAGSKPAAVIYANFPDTRMLDENGQPIVLASQLFGSGRTMYLGSGETWRLRSESGDYHERLWTKMLREVSQGRRRRGSSPVTLLPEKKEVTLGETVVIRAIVMEPRDGDLKPSEAEKITMRLIDPRGEEVFPEPEMYPAEGRPGEFVGNFRAIQPGRYRVLLPVPGSEDQVREETIDVVFPGLEDVNTEQNIRLLTELSRQTGGQYLTIDEAADMLPELLKDRSRTDPVDQQIRTLWDREWVLWALVGVLSLEWLTRKLLRLA